MAKKKKQEERDDSMTLPDGMLVYGHLFVKQQYNDASKPQYSAEAVYDEDDLIECGFYDAVDAIMEEEGWEEGDEGFNHPAKDGNKKAKRREKKGKDGSAYEDKIILKATTDFNKDGDDDSGGVQVYDEDVNEIDFTEKKSMYNGCIIRMGIKLKAYEMSEDNYGVKCYLTAVQRAGDGERLGGSSDHSSLFEKVGRKGKDKKKKKKRKG